MYIAQRRPNDTVEGIEIAPLPWLISKVRSRMQGSRAAFSMGTLGVHLTSPNMTLCLPIGHRQPCLNLWQKASQEMRKGSLLVSLEFEIPDTLPSQIIHTGTIPLPNFTFGACNQALTSLRHSICTHCFATLMPSATC